MVKLKSDKDVLRLYQASPIPFIQDMFSLKPLKDGELFVKGKHISPQQLEILKAVEKALSGEKPPRISVASGHGIGKSSCLSWIILWYLFSFYQSQIACTAPTSAQMSDVLWKEVSLWINRMPKEVGGLYEHTHSHVRIKESSETWFARAKTAAKENPEALAGVHGEHVLYVADEASAVPLPIFQTMEGALTGGNILVILCSNPTRLIGYFYDSHHKEKDYWQTLQFNSVDSPLVEDGYVERMKIKYDENDDEYRVRVSGLFPKADAVDDLGYVPLLTESDLHYFDKEMPFNSLVRLGVDPAGEGSNKTVWTIRDKFRAVRVASEKVSNPKGIAQKTLTIMTKYNIKAHDVYVDNFGVGANVVQELAIAGAYVQGINVGDKADDDERFMNLRAEVYFRAKEWLRSGGELNRDNSWLELLSIRFKRGGSKDRIQIMSKEKMRKEGIQSPDCFVAGTKVLTPHGDIDIEYLKEGDVVITPFGTRRVIKRWKRKRGVIARHGLIGTPSHKVYTNNGIKRLDSLTNIDRIESDSLLNLLRWRFQNLLNFRKRNIGFKEMVDTTMQTHAGKKEKEKSSHSTMQYGNFIIKPKCQVDTTFTILMEMCTIIKLKTLSWLRGKFIGKNICVKDLKIQNTESVIRNSLTWQEKRQVSGIGQKKQWSFIRRLASLLGKVEKRLKQNVKGAGRFLKPFSQLELNGVVGIAPKIINTKQGIMALQRISVPIVGKSMKCGLIGQQNIVQEGVQTEKDFVYNITLDHDNAYYANGKLVFNCADSLSLTFSEPDFMGDVVVQNVVSEAFDAYDPF